MIFNPVSLLRALQSRINPCIRILHISVICIAGLTGILFLSDFEADAQDNLQITPKRLFLEDSMTRSPGEQETVNDTATVSVKLVPVCGIAVPVIVRTVESSAALTISDLKLQSVKENPGLSFLLNRSGNISVFGDLAVVYTSLKGKLTRVGSVKGIAVYPPDTKRRYYINLNRIPGVDYRAGTLRVVFLTLPGVKPVIYADAEMTII